MSGVPHPGRLFLARCFGVGNYRVSHMDGEERITFAEESAPSGTGSESDDHGNDRQGIPKSHIESAYLERSERCIVVPTATFGEDVNPLIVGMQFVKCLIEFPETAEVIRDGDAAYVFHQETILAVESLCVHRDPRLPIAHRLEHANHIPSMNVIADGHRPVGKELAILTDFLTTFDLEAITDSVYGKSQEPGNTINDEMPYLELQRFVKIGIGLVKFDVLSLFAYGGHSRKRVIPREFG